MSAFTNNAAASTKAGHGTCITANGTFNGVRFVKALDYVQIIGVSNFTMNGRETWVESWTIGVLVASRLIRSVECTNLSDKVLAFSPHTRSFPLLAGLVLFWPRSLRMLYMCSSQTFTGGNARINVGYHKWEDGQ